MAKLCTAFKSASTSLCQSLAEIAKRLCTSFVDPQGLAPLLASRLIALDKCPGVRPIGVGDTARRIITKAVLVIARYDIQDAAGSVQLCAEASIHSFQSGFQDDDAESTLFVDASNAFNSINWMSAMLNIRHLCPSIATILINCYREPTVLSLMETSSTRAKEPHRGTPLECPCTL